MPDQRWTIYVCPIHGPRPGTVLTPDAPCGASLDKFSTRCEFKLEPIEVTPTGEPDHELVCALQHARTEIERRLDADQRQDDALGISGSIPFDEDLGEALNVVEAALRNHTGKAEGRG